MTAAEAKADKVRKEVKDLGRDRQRGEGKRKEYYSGNMQKRLCLDQLSTCHSRTGRIDYGLKMQGWFAQSRSIVFDSANQRSDIHVQQALFGTTESNKRPGRSNRAICELVPARVIPWLGGGSEVLRT